VAQKVPFLMDSIKTHGVAENFTRTLPADRRNFLRNFVESQMVVFEEASWYMYSSGWFYWNFKMEGGAFAEWDFLRGVQEGWIPKIPQPHISSKDLYGSCYSIMMRTEDYMSVIDEFPKPCTDKHCPPIPDPGEPIDDDVVKSHGINVFLNKDGSYSVDYSTDWGKIFEQRATDLKKFSRTVDSHSPWQLYAAVLLVFLAIFFLFIRKKCCLQRQRDEYRKILEVEMELENSE
jgi:hypothetical protein